ncbi:PKD domain-containing protein [Geomonas paludis]|uniref:Cytochrome c n=1 Tax=Geomonas paludis TaxID=2740185 RepID=A0A6V8MXC3_9BACT|nr:multiheme c-type cytochrome [Geomonas paludis]UPU37142.1 PKD domain-containing protein [Geomonas paludis]GFO64761.1 cytochrome c [Geomonas paludis]
MYQDGGAPTYDAAAAKSTDPVYTSYTPFSFGTIGTGLAATDTSLQNFMKKADNSVAGEMRDCGECHVGGGFMQYYISSADASKKFQYNPDNRTDYRDATFTTVNAFNTYIDIFGLDGLGYEPTDHNGVARTAAQEPTYDAKINDFAETGVLEMDCLSCHLDGYDWAARRDQVRKGNFDSSRVAGAGFGTAVSGTNVTYDPTKVVAVTDETTGDVTYKLSANAGAKILGTPTSTNCASCHMAEHQVDWKKRGEMWKEGNDVHYGVGCMACHERKPGTAVGKTGLVTEVALGQCDPAKGNKSPYDALWNPLDGAAFKTCEDCHTPAATPTWNTYGAAQANQAHQKAGLTAILLQAAGEKGGVATKSHIDMIDCTACHTKNKDGITGGAFVDGTGTDLEGRVALHDENQVSKNMNNGLALHWLGGKLYSANLLTSFFWRDMNDFGYDANLDGRAGGMDALLPSHVAKINKINGVEALSVDGIDAAEITARQTMLTNGLEALTGVAFPLKADGVTKNFTPRISMLTVPFKATHNVAPAAEAWGKTSVDPTTGALTYGCNQCHADNGGFYNGAYPVNGNISWTFGPNQLATFTKVNGKMDPSEGHPNIMDKHGKRTVAFQLFDPATSTSLTDIDRSAVIYEATFKAPAAALTTWSEAAIVAGAVPTGCTNSSADGGVSTKGHILKIDVQKNTGTAEAPVWVDQPSRTWAVNGEYTSIDALIDGVAGDATKPGMGVFASNANSFGFTITNAGGKLSINPASGYRVKINSRDTDFGPFGFGGNAFAATKQGTVIKGKITNNEAAGRVEWVGYLNQITATDSGIGIDPAASITTVIADVDPVAPGTQVFTTDSLVLNAADAQGGKGFSTYTWTAVGGTATQDATDPKKATVTFTGAGSKSVTLVVKDEEGKSTSTTKSFEAVVPQPSVISWNDNAGNLGGTLTLTGLPANTQVKVMWGDAKYNIYLTSGATTISKTHTYLAAGTKLIQVYVYNGTAQVGYFYKNITVDGAN